MMFLKILVIRPSKINRYSTHRIGTQCFLAPLIILKTRIIKYYWCHSKWYQKIFWLIRTRHVTDFYFDRMTYLLKERISDSTDTHLWDSNDHWIMKVISMHLSLNILKNFEIWIWLIKLISFRQRSFYRTYIISIEITCDMHENS